MKSEKYKEVLDHPDRWLSDQQRRWLSPRGFFGKLTYSALYVINWVLIRLLFRVTVHGRERLPATRPFIVTPNHASAFDPPILAAVLPLSVLQETFWAGKRSTVMRTGIRRILSWLTRVIPVDSEIRALAPAVTILTQRNNLVWFPEGRRSLDGRVQEFRRGIALLLSQCDVPVVPIYIEGAYDAFPDGATLPRLRAAIVVRIGVARARDEFGIRNGTVENLDQTLQAIRQCMIDLREQEPVATTSS